MREHETHVAMPASTHTMTRDKRDPALDDRARLEELFRDHVHAVTRYVRRRAGSSAVDDVVAETFLVAWRRLDRVPEDALPWLLGVARRTLSTQTRSARRQSALAAKLATAADPSPEAATAELDGAVEAALARLRPLDREAITLIAWEELTPAQAAVVLGQTRVAFRVRLHRARRRLREDLERDAAAGSPVRPLEAEC